MADIVFPSHCGNDCVRILQLEGRRVALWGWGREGRAAYAAVRTRIPSLPLTVFCTDEEAVQVEAIGDRALHAQTRVDAEALARFEFVIKSPGISPCQPDAIAAFARGTRFIGGTALWFAEHGGDDNIVPHTICVTGTKGKSTTTSLLAHLLRAAGHRTALAGNIGVPLLELLDPTPAPEFWAIELSSYQTGDVADSGTRPEVAVVLNLFPEHLDWHGSEQRYVEDKLALVTRARPRIAVLNAMDPVLSKLALPDSQIRWFNHPEGWHLRGDDLYRGDALIMDTRSVPVPGRHNRSNLCAVLTALEAVGIDAMAIAHAARDFRPLPNRLQTLGERDGRVYVNDSISTTPHASLAALEVFSDRPVALLIGGHDRGLDWNDFAAHVMTHAPRVIITMGANGPRIHALLQSLADTGAFELCAAKDLADAVELARKHLQTGVILLSPGAPSFGQYRDYVARGRHFAELAGFDPDLISAISGIGIA